jgi:hypothetical protein
VKTPEEALAAARERAASSPAEPGDGGPNVEEARAASLRRLAAWAIIEPDEAEVYSTRRFGGPVTAVKRVLIRLLRQYLVQMSAQQSRFNAEVAAHVMALEERVSELEQRTAPPRAGFPPQ